MNGVHDMGGMDGFGPVRREPNEPVFHEAWERRVFGMFLTTLGQGLYNLDEVRHAMERIPPAEYLEGSYYEHWLGGLERLLVEKGIATAEEIEAHRAAADRGVAPAERDDPSLTAALEQGIRTGGSTARGEGRARFAAGERVRVRRTNPKGHTRSPRYVRGAEGVVAQVYPKFVFPDTNAHGKGPAPEIVYSVRFRAADVWGSDAEAHEAIYVDLWESYLEPPADRAKAPKRRARAKTPAGKRQARAPERKRRSTARVTKSRPAKSAKRGGPARRKPS